ncbi:c-type cytochrome [Parvularcula oceani]|uniref:c-type cytochrome n=1 Tax=Parvularcula oceani TaxID=1247963 RepID=UPI000689F86A|nr:cytochrome c family protein [Parvularcula oceani]
MRILALLLLGSGLAACSGGDAPEPLTAEERLAMPADPVTGRQLFRACAVCHAFREGEPHRVGPNLYGIVGAPSARHPDFAYSRALERADLVWDEAALNAFIENPQQFLPGNRMGYAGQPNPADRRDILAFLKTLEAEAAPQDQAAAPGAPEAPQ